MSIYAIKNGKLEKIDTPENHRIKNLPVGTVLYYTGNMANPDHESVVVGRVDLGTWGIAYDVVNLENYTASRVEYFAINDNIYKLTKKTLSPDEMLDVVKMAEVKKAHTAEAKALEALRRATLKKKIIEENPDLLQGQWQVVASKNIKKELKKKFPKTKFSVTSETYSGGDSVSVDWTDGPKTSEVNEIICKYKKGSFDSMTDYYEYDHRNVWPDVFGGSKYINTSRHFSDELIKKSLDIMGPWRGQSGVDVIYQVADFRKGNMDYHANHRLMEIVDGL